MFILCFCSGLILFYLVTAIAVHCAYREWKGIAEECAGGSVNGVDGNILHYAVISKREEAAIQERAEILRKKQAKREKEEGDKQPLMMGMEDEDVA